MEKQTNRLKRLIDLIDRAYPDGLVGQYYADPDGDHGDSLARFIANDIRETFAFSGSWEEQLDAAIDRIARANAEIGGVLLELQTERDRFAPEARTDGQTYLRCLKCGQYVIEGEIQAHMSREDHK